MTYATMKKDELRAACKAAGISYSKLDNAGMRAALEAAAAAANATDNTEDNLLYDHCGYTHCPSCGVHLSNGLLHCDDEGTVQCGAFAVSASKSLRDMGQMTTEWQCMGCGHGFGEAVQPTVRTSKPDSHTGTGLKIEKNREERNGVKRPSVGGKCRAIWDALDELQAELEEGETVTSKMVQDLAKDEGWNKNNASIEFYNWRKFNGVKGR